MTQLGWSPTNKNVNITLLNNNTRFTSASGSVYQPIKVDKPILKNIYFEQKIIAASNINDCSVGVIIEDAGIEWFQSIPNAKKATLYRGNGSIWMNGANTISSLPTFGVNDVIGVAIDPEQKIITFYKNNNLVTSFSYYVEQGKNIVGISSIYGSATVDGYFIRSNLNYSPPSGYFAYGEVLKTLIFANGEYKSFINNDWQVVTLEPPTEQDFINNGMNGTDLLNLQALQLLGIQVIEILVYTNDPNRTSMSMLINANYSPLDELDDPELLLWTDDTSTTTRTLKTTAIPRPKLVMPLQDLDIKGDLQKIILSSIERSIYTDNLIPKMTNSTSPSGIASSSSTYSETTFGAWYAFNGIDKAEGWLSKSGVPMPQWIAYEFLDGNIITKYSIKSGSHTAINRYPNSWTFEGSNDDTNWVVLDTQKDKTWAVLEKKEFTINNNKSYKKYRVNISKIIDNNYVNINLIEMFKTVSSPILRLIGSGDQGSTWKSYKSNLWHTVDMSNLSNVKNNGMTTEEANSLTELQWKSLSSNGKIRLAYYLEQENSTDVVQINSLSATSSETTFTPTLNSLTIIYDELDRKYSGLMFMDTSQQFYSTSIGEILKYLDMGTLVAGQTSLDIKVKLTNTYPFNVNNVRLWAEHSIDGLTIDLSKSANPFVAESELIYDEQLNFDEVIEFNIRLTVDTTATAGGNFDIRVSADPI